MNLKVTVAVGLFLLLLTGNVLAQRVQDNPRYGVDSTSRIECAKNLSTMSQFVKINVFDYAYPAWVYCFKNCPEASKNIYIHGEKILEYKITNAANDEEKNLFVDTLMLMYDKRIEIEPNKKGYILDKKGRDLFQFRPDYAEKAYGYLTESIELRKANSSEASLVGLLRTSFDLYKKDIHGSDVLVLDYVKAIDILDKKQDNGKTDRAKAEINEILERSGAANTEKIIEIFEPKFNEDPQNIDLLKLIAKLLKVSGGEMEPLYAKVLENLYELEPSVQLAADIGELFDEKGEYSKSEQYFAKAIEQETDKEKKADYNFKAGHVCLKNNSFPKVRKYALAALENRSVFGRAYILIGLAYAESRETCGSDDVDKKTVYWAAVDKFTQAKNNDPSVADEANDLIKKFSQYFPNNEDIFFKYGKHDGQPFTVCCWINENTIIRTIHK
jgi:tetratricopeptide (TPR) repeat protein